MKKENGLQVATSPKTNTQRDRLLSFYLGGDVILDAEEEQLRIRVEAVHEILRSWKFKRDEIVEMITKRFPGVSKYRAERDIAVCHYIFGKSYQVNKTFVTSQLIEQIQESILEAKASKNPIERAQLPRLYDSLTKAIQQLPDESISPSRGKRIFVFNLHGNKEYRPGMDFNEALERLKQRHRANTAEDAEFEDLSQ